MKIVVSQKVRQGTKDALFVIPDSKLEMSRNNTLLLVIPRGVTRKFENLSGEILKDSSEVY